MHYLHKKNKLQEAKTSHSFFIRKPQWHRGTKGEKTEKLLAFRQTEKNDN